MNIFDFLKFIIFTPMEISKLNKYSMDVATISKSDEKSSILRTDNIKRYFKGLYTLIPEIMIGATDELINTYERENELLRNQKSIIEEKAKSIFNASTLIVAVGSIVVGGIIKDLNNFNSKLSITLCIICLMISLITSIYVLIYCNTYVSVLSGDDIDKDIDALGAYSGLQNGIRIRYLYLEYNYVMNSIRSLLVKYSFIWFMIGFLFLVLSLFTYIWGYNTTATLEKVATPELVNIKNQNNKQ